MSLTVQKATLAPHTDSETGAIAVLAVFAATRRTGFPCPQFARF